MRLFTTNERWLATARGRLGYAADRWMWYVTGGAVLDRLRRQQRRPTRFASSASATRVNKNGWIVGVGTEYALLGGWSVKSELLYANFGSMHYGDSRQM